MVIVGGVPLTPEISAGHRKATLKSRESYSMLIDVRSTLTPVPHLWIIIADDNLYHHVSVDEFRDALCYAAAAGSGLTTKEPATANHPI